MTKTLTEQWKDGELYSGVYYCKTKSLGIKKLYLHHKAYGGMYADTYSQEEHYPDEDIEEVLAPVPDYQTWKDFQQHFVDKLELEVKLKKAYEQLEQESIKVVELQEQLNEANTILKDVFISDAYYKSKQVQYLKKWGVK